MSDEGTYVNSVWGLLLVKAYKDRSTADFHRRKQGSSSYDIVYVRNHLDGLVQERRNSIANALE